ncbi:MAG: alpha/beta fold hydrolase, partial [Proteobacteria bacterium]
TRLTSVRFLALRNRNGGSDPSAYFGDERSTVHAGHCEVTWTPIRALNAISENSPIYIPSEDLDVTAVIELPVQVFWREFASRVADRRPVLFVHGYNVGFERGCQWAARFSENLALDDRLLLFSWPSDGAVLNYTRDEADVVWSVKHLRETLTRMEMLFGRGGFDVVGHSLGARGTALALAGMIGLPADAEPLVDRLVLVAADIDAAIFRQMLPRLTHQARHLTAYVSDNDNALSLSRELHGYPRLGEVGPHLVDLRGVELVDVSPLPVRRVSGHLYHLYNRHAARDMSELLNDRLDAAGRSQPVRVDPTIANLWRLPTPDD